MTEPVKVPPPLAELVRNDEAVKSKFWVALADPDAPTVQLLPVARVKVVLCPAHVIVAAVTEVPEVPELVIVRKLPTKLPQVKVLPELVERKSPYLKFPPITATSAEFVDVPKTPNTNPATATEPTRVTATISTVATKGEMALFPRTHPAAKAAHRGFLRRIHDPGRPNNSSQTRVRVTRPQLSLSLRLPLFHHPSCAFSGPKASLISPCL